MPWYSSYSNDFNYDFQVTLDASVPPLSYNYRPQPDLLQGEQSTELPGHSCFLRDGGEIFHTYSTYGRGNEYTPSLSTFLALTALGRQEAWEEPKARAPVLHDTLTGTTRSRRQAHTFRQALIDAFTLPSTTEAATSSPLLRAKDADPPEAADSLDSHLGGARTLILPGRIAPATRESA